MRFRLLRLSLGVVALVSSLVAAPAPYSKVKWDAVEAGGLHLEIGWRKDGEARSNLARCQAELVLRNCSDRARVLEGFRGLAASTEGRSRLRFVVRFPDGLVEQLTLEGVPWAEPLGGAGGKSSTLEIPPGDSASGVVHLASILTQRFADLARKHRWRFCLTAVIPERRIQSNTIRYNNCPPPPRNYRPLDYASEELPD